MEEKKELIFARPLTREDVLRINENAPVKVILRNTKDQNPKILLGLSKDVTIIIRNDLEEKATNNENQLDEIEYTPDELSRIIERLDQLDSTVNPEWTDLQKATYLYVSFVLALKQNINENNDLGLKSLYLGGATPLTYATIYKEVMDRHDIPCRIITSDSNHRFNEIMINNTYYPLDLYLDAKRNEKLLEDENRFELTNFLSDREFYERPEHTIRARESSISQNVPALNHELIQEAINTVLHEEPQEIKGKTEIPRIMLRSKELQQFFKKDILENSSSIEEISEIRIDLTDSQTDELQQDLQEIGKYYPQLLSNVTISNSTDSHIDMQQIVDTIYTSKISSTASQSTSIPTKLVIEGKTPEDFDLDFSKAPVVEYDDSHISEEQDISQKISFKNTSGTPIKMPQLREKIPSTVDTIAFEDFDLSGFNISTAKVNVANGVLSDGIRLELSGSGTSGVQDITGLDKIISLSINNIPPNEFDEVMKIALDNPSQMGRLFDLSIQNQRGLKDRKFFEEIRNPNIVKLVISDHELNNIDGLEHLRGQLLKLYIESNLLTIDQMKRINSFHQNNPYIHVLCAGNNATRDAINNLGNNTISDETYNYLDNLFRRSGYINYRNMRYHKIPQSNVTGRKTAILNDFFHWSMENVPYYIEDAKVFRDILPLAFNPMMIKDVDTFKRYLNDPSNYFEQSHLKDGTLLLTIDQLNELISSGKRIPQNIHLQINRVNELDNATLNKLKQDCDSHGINFSGIRVFDQRQLNPANPNERVFDTYDTQYAEYSIDEYKKIRQGLEEIVGDIDNSLSDVEKFAIIYYRLSKKISTYDTSAISDSYSKEHAIYQNKVRNTSRNLSEGLIPQEGFDLNTNSPDRTLINRCVCAGYADILKNALALVGVESIVDSGATRIDSSDPNHPKYSRLHAWNRIKIDGKWYYADLCWDRGERVIQNGGKFLRALRGGANDHFANSGISEGGNPDITVANHFSYSEPNLRSEKVEDDPYDQQVLNDLFQKVKDGRLPNSYEIDVPSDPDIDFQLDQDKIKDEYQRRRKDMYAKFYGDREYQAEYDERASRFRQHEIETTNGSITYRTIEDYPEKEEDEKFLILGEYQKALERMTKYEAGDTSVYSGTADQINAALERDREYVNTRNHTFNQNEHTQRDLATLGKFGETLPYIPRQTGLLRNVGRGILNAGIFARNLVAPVYRFIGRNVAQPIHRLITGNRDASPYRNNIYHRMVARRDYFYDMARQRDEDETNNRKANSPDPNNIRPVSHPIRNALESRFRAIFNAREGNEAVLRAGAYDIRQNIEQQEGARVLIQSLDTRKRELERQIAALEREISSHPHAKNISNAKTAVANKKALLASTTNMLNIYLSDGNIADIQTDAISHEQHAIASKEVNTARVTMIKGVAKGLAVRYVGPKIRDWLLERGKTVQEVEVPITREVPDKKWVKPVTEAVPETRTETVFDKAESLRDVMQQNSGKQVSGYYSVWGGERGAANYTLSGNEKITAIFKATEKGGVGLSDKAGLTAPTLTDGLFANNLLDSSGVLNQNISIETLLSGVKDGTIDASSFEDVYLAVGDRFWVKAKDILSAATKNIEVETGKTIEKIITPGHWVEGTKTIHEIVKTTEVVDNPIIQQAVGIGGNAMSGIIGMDSIQDLVENVRKTTTDQKSNKKKPRNYTYDDGESEPIPTSKREYDSER